jgi:hypothetical protein
VDREHYRPLVEHWDGTRWKLIPTPDVGAGDGFLSGVAAVGPGDVWAVGWTAHGDSLQPLVEHWDGRTWSVVPGPAGAEHAALMSVAATPNGVVTVGRLLTTAQPQPLALLRVGDAWTTLSTDVSSTAWLTGVTVDAAGAIWAVGTQFPGNTFAGSLAMTGCPAP